MSYSTFKITLRNDAIEKYLHDLGYSIISFRDLLVNNFGYESTKEINKTIWMTSDVLYMKLAYRDNYSYKLLLDTVNNFLEYYNDNKLTLGRISKYSPIMCLRSSLGSNLKMFWVYNIFGSYLENYLKRNNLESPYEIPSYIP